MDRELLKGSTPTLVLSMLTERPMYGFQMIEKVREATGGTYTLKEGALYPALHKLEAAEYVRSSWIAVDGGREKRVYEILPAGMELLDRKKSDWNRFVDMVEGIVGGR